MKRPIGFTVLALVMGWLGISAFLNAWAFFTGGEIALPIALLPLMILYGITALATMVGIWKMRYWVLIALKSWMAICGFSLLAMGYYFNTFILGGVLGLLGFVIFISVLFAFLYGYVERNITNAA